MPPRRLVELAAALAACFVALAWRIAAADDAPGDDAVLDWVGTAAEGPLGPAARLVDNVTGYLPIAVVAVLFALALVRVGRTGDGARALLSVAGALAGATLLKHLVGRPRPDQLPSDVDVSTFSFPSGHATATAAVAAVVVLAAIGSRWLMAAVIVSALVVVVSAAAQLILLRHHPSDLAGGWLWAAAWTTAVWAMARLEPRYSDPGR